jgi:hypothetical protein
VSALPDTAAECPLFIPGDRPERLA